MLGKVGVGTPPHPPYKKCWVKWGVGTHLLYRFYLTTPIHTLPLSTPFLPPRILERFVNALFFSFFYEGSYTLHLPIRQGLSTGFGLVGSARDCNKHLILAAIAPADSSAQTPPGY